MDGHPQYISGIALARWWSPSAHRHSKSAGSWNKCLMTRFPAQTITALCSWIEDSWKCQESTYTGVKLLSASRHSWPCTREGWWTHCRATISPQTFPASPQLLIVLGFNVLMDLWGCGSAHACCGRAAWVILRTQKMFKQLIGSLNGTGGLVGG